MKTTPKKKKCNRQNGCQRRPYNSYEKRSKRQRRKGKIYLLRRGGKNTQKHYTKKIFMTQITMMV